MAVGRRRGKRIRQRSSRRGRRRGGAWGGAHTGCPRAVDGGGAASGEARAPEPSRCGWRRGGDEVDHVEGPRADGSNVGSRANLVVEDTR